MSDQDDVAAGAEEPPSTPNPPPPGASTGRGGVAVDANVLWVRNVILVVMLLFSGLAINVTLMERSRLDAQLSFPPVKVTAAFDGVTAQLLSSLDAVKLDWYARVRFEEETIQGRRLLDAAVLRTKFWIRFMAFFAGMLLAFAGSLMILGQYEAATRLAAKGYDIEFSLKSSSPGLVLASLGIVLMGLAVAMPGSFEHSDDNVYLKAVPINAYWSEDMAHSASQSAVSNANVNVKDMMHSATRALQSQHK